MKIALVNPEYPSPSGLDHGGIATYTYCMAEAFVQQGHRVHILVKKGTALPPLSPTITVRHFSPSPAGGPLRFVHKLANGALYWERCYCVGLRKTLLSIDAEESLDVVEVPEYNGLAHALTPPLRFPVVIHFHTPSVLVDYYNAVKLTARQKQWHAFEAKALSVASGFRCPSRALAEDVAVRYAIPPSHIALIRHPVDTVPFDTIKREYDDSRIDILFVGRLERRKGAEIVRAHIKEILGLDPRIQFTFAGELSAGDMGNNRNSIERRLSEGDRKRVYFLGPVIREDLPVLYCRSSFLLFPSIFENAPYTLLEAMAAGLPVVCARCGGIPEIIRHGENGLLFDLENGTDLTECVKRLIDNRQFAQSLAAQAYTEVIEKYRPELIAHTTVDFYSGIIARYNRK